MQTKKQKISQLLGVVAIGTVLGVSLQFGRAAWSEPTMTAPSDNVGAPLNTGIVTQLKNGSLGINGVFRVYKNASIGNSIIPNSTKGTDGYLTAKDVYLQDAGKWASATGSATITCPCGTCWKSKQESIYPSKPGVSTCSAVAWKLCTPTGWVQTSEPVDLCFYN